MSITRRQFTAGMGQAAVLASMGLSAPALGNSKAKVVVIGGGAGGATAAKYISKGGNGAVDVTLIEASKSYITCFHSNLVLGGMKTMENITHSYDALGSKYGIKLVHQHAAGIDRNARRISLADGSTVEYDALVLSPGIDLKYDSVPGWSKADEEKMPHGWKAGPQTLLLKQMLDATPDGGVIVMLAPPNPYRCPPGPYERVSMMAHTLKRAGKTKCKIIILDPKDKFSKQALFLEGWEKHYPKMVEWLGKDIYEKIVKVDPSTNTVETSFETYKNAALVNVIPAQMAGAIARDAGLADETGFCPVNPETMQSKMDPNIYVIGDACGGGDMPKSAFGANSQAKVAVAAICEKYAGAAHRETSFNNICWSIIDDGDAVKVGGRYIPQDGKIASASSFISKTGEDAGVRKMTLDENLGWYDAMIGDTFL
ncbi:flavocytochrome C [Hyphomicrobium methylovorum]|uniref:NAD(P)/FAD-dependent oxidoreductase n=1 Tax=Hyphomicrobium methylovorum TaxID=84 RepID=UPI0015E68116|nr:NAD(P)/FAD-dependent oxidoreductase [Hyphomicrobium methylovorum]MBA2126976.1 flavocytochrome C [Hyphomicrobium methylovorum]